MTLVEQLRGNFPKTIDKSKPIFSSIIANDKNNASIQKQLVDLFNYMKEWISTPNVYDQTGVMLDKTINFFSFLERFADETETSFKKRFAAIFIRNHDTRWGTTYDVKSVFRQYFPHAKVYLVENTNKIDEPTSEYANLFTDGDINIDTPTAWNPQNCSATTAARFSKAYGMELGQSGGHFEQTVTVLNRKKINDTEPYEYKNLTYYLHFFLSGRVNVKVYNSSNSKYWDNSTKSWTSTVTQNLFEKSEWDDCSLYFITEGNDDNTDITVTFLYENTPVASELENTTFKGQMHINWTLTNCTETDDVIELDQSGAKVEATVTIKPEKEYNLKFASNGKIKLTVKSNSNKYWDFDKQEWKSSATSNVYISSDWINRNLKFIPGLADSTVKISFEYINSTTYLKDIALEGELNFTETLTDCIKEYNVIYMAMNSSDVNYTMHVEPGSSYNVNFDLKGRNNILIQNDNNEYWDIYGQRWKATPVYNDVFSDSRESQNFIIQANANTTELTIDFGIPNSYLDYFRLYEKQPYASFTVIAYFEGNTSVGVFGLAAGDADPNIETAEATPPQPRYGNYGYFDKSFLSGIPIGFASDIYEDLLDYLRAQGVKAYLEIVIKDYSE